MKEKRKLEPSSPAVHIFISACICLQWSGQWTHLLLVLSAAS